MRWRLVPDEITAEMIHEGFGYARQERWARYLHAAPQPTRWQAFKAAMAQVFRR